MLPSPPVLPRVSVFSFHFPQFRMGAAEYEAGPPDDYLLACTSLGVSVPLWLSVRLSRARCLQMQPFHAERQPNTSFAVSKAEGSAVNSDLRELMRAFLRGRMGGELCATH
jgi:hypothetical protein